MPSLSFILNSRHRPKVFKSRPEIRRVTEQGKPDDPRESYEVLDIVHHHSTRNAISNLGQTHDLHSDAVAPHLLEQDQPIQVSQTQFPPRPWLVSDTASAPVTPSRDPPFVDVDLPEESSSLNSWFPAYFHQPGDSPPTASTVPNTNEPSSASHAPPSAWKKHTPSPIQIPSTSSLQSFDQTQPSRSAIPASNSSRPVSTTSLDDLSSSISGTTLARALIGSTFIFPSESRSSKYRSGMTLLTRQDSATLPAIDDGISSPYWRDRRVSGGSIVRTPDPFGDIPPVPAIPPALKSINTTILSNSVSHVAHKAPIHGNGGEQVNSSHPQTPSSPGSHPSLTGAYDSSNEVTGSPVTPSSTRPNSEHHSSLPAVDDVLDYYQFISSTELEQNTRPLFSPRKPPSSSAEVSRLPNAARNEIEEESSLAFSARPNTVNRKRNSNFQTQLPVGSPSTAPSRRLSDSNKVNTSLRPGFNRGRSGSAPSPIIVVRDPNDHNVYNITVSPVNETFEVNNPTIPHGDIDAGLSAGRQTFPETPNVFSPFLSPLQSHSVPDDSQNRLANNKHTNPLRTYSPQPQRRVIAKDVHRAASFNVRPSSPKGFGSSKARVTGSSDTGSVPAQVKVLAPPLVQISSVQAPLSHPPRAVSPALPAQASPSRPSPIRSGDTRPISSSRSSHLRTESESAVGTERNRALQGIINVPPSYSTIINPEAYEAYKAQLTSAVSHTQEVSEASSRGSERPSRIRPPLPLGPRQQGHGSPAAVRLRGRSITPTPGGSGSPPVTSNRKSIFTYSPKFQTQPPKFRGLTMEHAKWTFTSRELQDIVSQAIRKSSQTSSIRLLPQQALQDEIPEELVRLEGQRDDFKTRYRLLARKRTTLIASLTAHLGPESGDGSSGAGARVIEELGHLSAQMDQIAEELYGVTEQIGQINALRETHSYSALAIALRKLNTSFINQVERNQALSLEVESLKQERDIAWAQAERCAHDYDLLLEKSQPEANSQSNSSQHSSRVAAKRRSTARMQAALRSSGTRRSSASSNIARQSMSGLAAPVPQIPDNSTMPFVNSRGRESTRALETPLTGDSALIKAQQELYEMLGITDWQTVKRRQSCSGEPSEKPHQQEIDLPPRPTSLPDHSKESNDTSALHTLAYLNVE